ncbi:hypothetical protein BCR34DRAFT_587840 [Clohesyomyces aquaticus]|uniref:Uncharacterized protein n=1 Tax=Clohesyomyces aquaticus TaxID=1231657 RepID=A0A1Y1ZNA8_9PLEO|nr:hypothetical protein BCR34DRAFT_587840 [Clohesyomyces aquaticus]
MGPGTKCRKAWCGASRGHRPHDVQARPDSIAHNGKVVKKHASAVGGAWQVSRRRRGAHVAAIIRDVVSHVSAASSTLPCGRAVPAVVLRSNGPRRCRRPSSVAHPNFLGGLAGLETWRRCAPKKLDLPTDAV